MLMCRIYISGAEIEISCSSFRISQSTHHLYLYTFACRVLFFFHVIVFTIPMAFGHAEFPEGLVIFNGTYSKIIIHCLIRMLPGIEARVLLDEQLNENYQLDVLCSYGTLVRWKWLLRNVILHYCKNEIKKGKIGDT